MYINTNGMVDLVVLLLDKEAFFDILYPDMLLELGQVWHIR